MSPAESNDLARSVNAYNARVHSAVNALIWIAARYAVGIVGGGTLGLYLLGRYGGGQ